MIHKDFHFTITNDSLCFIHLLQGTVIKLLILQFDLCWGYYMKNKRKDRTNKMWPSFLHTVTEDLILE